MPNPLLSSKEIDSIFKNYGWHFNDDTSMYLPVANAIERAVIEKVADLIESQNKTICTSIAQRLRKLSDEGNHGT